MIWFLAYIGIGIATAFLLARLLDRRDPLFAKQFVDGLFSCCCDPMIFFLVPLWPVFLAVLWSEAQTPPSEDIGYKIPTSVQSDKIGKRGTVVTSLRPAGLIRIEDEFHEALSMEGVIKAGSSVTVVGQDGLNLKVEASRDATVLDSEHESSP